ncbi:DUF2726 domain-containing protein [Pseudogemmobacter bohemicus]|uniref:DUF2726 domain-containing protein n=1 Tax=Pseudogemmobacter bohemicus TaxID=2250708 RepID=UPI000DD41242|nr:DUF2726 domain-containing protein [Pseudogemmobacter bohemicus]
MEVFLIVILIGAVAALKFSGGFRKSGGYRGGYNRYNRRSDQPASWQDRQRPADGKVTVEEQLSALRATNISARRPINKSAYRILVMIERTLKAEAPRARVMAEVGMGAFLSTRGAVGLTTQDKMAFGAFNAKRVDFLVIDGFGEPCFAVEYQGSGHHVGDTAAARDVLKREALRLGGVELVEIHAHTSEEELLALLTGAVRRMNTRPKARATA